MAEFYKGGPVDIALGAGIFTSLVLKGVKKVISSLPKYAFGLDFVRFISGHFETSDVFYSCRR